MSDARVPVICIHGALRSRLGMVPTAWMLARHGLSARTFGYATRTRTLEQHAEALARFVRAWAAAARAPVLGFFTHSMGALVVRAFLAAHPQLAGPEQRIVMLSPPNRGSQLAARHRGWWPFHLVYGVTADVLQPESVATLPPPPATARVLILAGGTGTDGYNPRIDGDDDGLVACSEMGLPGIDPTFVGGLHSWLQWRPSLVRRAAEFFATGRA